jgi:hypothetical protein
MLEKAGADIIQTEGGMPMKPSAGGIQGLIEKAAPTLAATAGALTFISQRHSHERPQTLKFDVRGHIFKRGAALLSPCTGRCPAHNLI